MFFVFGGLGSICHNAGTYRRIAFVTVTSVLAAKASQFYAHNTDGALAEAKEQLQGWRHRHSGLSGEVICQGMLRDG